MYVGRKHMHVKAPRVLSSVINGRRVFACYNCGELGHTRRECGASKVVSKCAPLSPISVRYCTRAATSSGTGSGTGSGTSSATESDASSDADVDAAVSTSVCTLCGQPGHIKKQCLRFRTKLCTIPLCKNARCPFAHNPDELRRSPKAKTLICERYLRGICDMYVLPSSYA